MESYQTTTLLFDAQSILRLTVVIVGKLGVFLPFTCFIFKMIKGWKNIQSSSKY